MLCLHYCRHVCVPPKGTNMALYNFGRHTSANSARMKNSRDLILGEAVYIAIIHHIPDSCIYLLNGYDFIAPIIKVKI